MLEGLNLETAAALLGLKEVIFQNKKYIILELIIIFPSRHVNATDGAA
jgi:hypothetical protein